MTKVLIVGDEKSIYDSIDMNLTAAGYHYRAVQDGVSTLKMIEGESFDPILPDVMLPGADGYDIMEYIRPPKVPVIFITAKHKVRDRVRGLWLGADDYLVRPFDMVELVARVKVVLRGYNKTERLLRAGDMTVDVEARMIVRAGRPVVPTNEEFGFLPLFIRNKNIVLFRKTLYGKVWEGEYSGDNRALDFHVQRLRRKLGWEDSLMAVYKVGYHLEVSQ